MKSYKTTISGLLASVGLILAENDNPIISAIGRIMEAVGLLLVGSLAKDHNVTGKQ